MNAQLKTESREQALDVIRTIAILLVVFNHAAELLFGINLDFGINIESMQAASVSTRIIAFSWFTLGRLGAPLFLLLTGYLLLSRPYDSEGIKKFYKKNLLPLLITWEIWVLLYNIYICLYTQTAFSIGTYLKNALFIKTVELPHIWYVPTILGIYLFIPLVARVLQSINEKLLFILAAIVFIYFFVVPSVNLFKGAQSQLNLYFSGGTYGLYLTAGYYLKTHPKKMEKASAWILSALFICACFAATVFVQVFLASRGKFYSVWYDFLLLPPISIILFTMFLQKKNWKLKRVFYRISLSAFGIYLIHELIMLTAVYMIRPAVHLTGWAILLTLGTFLLSYAIVELISLIPRCGKVLFLRK